MSADLLLTAVSGEALLVAAVGTGGITTLILGLRSARRDDSGAAVEQAGRAVTTMSTLVDELEDALTRARADRDRYLERLRAAQAERDRYVAALQSKNVEIEKLEAELDACKKEQRE